MFDSYSTSPALFRECKAQLEWLVSILNKNNRCNWLILEFFNSTIRHNKLSRILIHPNVSEISCSLVAYAQ